MTLSSLKWETAYGFTFTQSYYFGFGYFGCHELNSLPIVKRD
ncbi:unknown [Acidaminococcus sp. CAG:542]|jgi:hypothetical protein|nr:unknown [Acidaminococcus sp. CAG:542]